MLTTAGIALRAASLNEAAAARRRFRRRLLHGHDAAARVPGEEIGAQRRDDEQHREADGRGLGENEPELAHGIGQAGGG